MNNENVGSIEYDAVINTKNLKASAHEADNIAKKTGSNIESNLKKAAVGLAVIGAGLTLYAKNATDFTVDLFKSSKQLGKQIGVSTTEASRLTAAFSKMGLETEAVQQMFGIFSKNVSKATSSVKDGKLAHDKLFISIRKTKLSIAETSAEIAKNGDKSGALNLKLRELNNTLTTQQASLNKSKDSFQKLGISVVDAQGKQKDFNTILFEVADKFKNLPDGVNKTALSMELFGRSGKDMIKVLDLGSAGIKELETQADKLGLTLTADTIGKVNAFVQSQKDLKQQTDALKLAIGTATAPILTSFNTKLNELISSALNAEGALHGVAVAVLSFGGPIAAASAGALQLGANMAQIGIGTVARFGLIGAAAASLSAGFVYLTKSVFDSAKETGNANEATSNWQSIILSAIPLVGNLTVGTAAMAGSAQHATYTQAQLNAAVDAASKAYDAATLASDTYKNALLAQEGSQLAVRRAQLNYNTAVKQYGPKSLEAREALHQLKVAQQTLKDATVRARDAHKDLQKALDDVSTKPIQDRIKALIGKLQGLQGTARLAGEAVVTALISSSGRPGKSPEKRAGGGSVSAMTPYIIGEKGPELFIPKSSGTILPNDELTASDYGTRSVGSKIEVHNHFEGVMVSSKSDLRIVGERIIASVDDARRAKGLQPINGSTA